MIKGSCKVSASVVLYSHSFEEISSLALHLLQFNEDITLYLVDNSPENKLQKLEQISENIQYFHFPENPGFGKAHNFAIRKAMDNGGKYHFVINPDIEFTENPLSPMLDYMELHQDVGMMMPKILNKDLTPQYLPKLLPSPYSVVLRKLKKPGFLYQKFINNYELRNVQENETYEAPILSGCFTLFRLEALQAIGLYDDAFFMYFEDWDISRRMNEKFKNIVYQKAAVVHHYESGANKNSKLFKIFLSSAFTYFSKWGWIFDKERARINQKTLAQFK